MLIDYRVILKNTQKTDPTFRQRGRTLARLRWPLARTSSNSKLQTRPLVREGVKK
jgi:hypothetical protein